MTSLEVDAAFSDPGAIAYDNEDGSLIVSSIHNVNVSLAGTYKIIYSVVDSTGNSVQVIRNVIVVDNSVQDTTPPTITILGNNPEKIYIGDGYTDAGASAFDNVDGNVSVGVNYSFSTNVEGTYDVTYTAVDSAGNQAQAIRQVMVVDNSTPDTTPPIITILGDNPLSVVQGSSYVDLGAKVTDNHDVALGYSSLSNVNTANIGTYSVVYSTTDSAGNSAEATRVVYVKDQNGNTAPKANAGVDRSVLPSDTIILDASQSYDLDGEIVSYAWEQNGTVISNETIHTLGTLAIGAYEYTLRVVDNEGASTTDTVQIRVLDASDTTPPNALITAPLEDTSVSKQIGINGTASDENLEYYELFYSPVGKENYVSFAKGDSSIINGSLGVFDATTVANGIYDIKLLAVDTNGEHNSSTTRVVVEGKTKIGNFSFTVTDFDISVGGLPVQVNRTYSTLQRNNELDFGYAWSIDYQNVKIEENIHPGKDWRMDPDLFNIGYCFKADKQHLVNISLPDGTTESFELTSQWFF